MTTIQVRGSHEVRRIFLRDVFKDSVVLSSTSRHVMFDSDLKNTHGDSPPPSGRRRQRGERSWGPYVVFVRAHVARSRTPAVPLYKPLTALHSYQYDRDEL